MNKSSEKYFGITGTGLKVIAMISMVIDHLAGGLFEYWIVKNMDSMSAATFANYHFAYKCMRGIGRMAFPIYCYLLVEGFLHTKNVKKYASRLAIIAVLSEIPFDYLFRRKLIFWEFNNVIWDLLISLGCLYAYSLIEKRKFNFTMEYVAKLSVMALGMTLAYFTYLDYAEAGVCCVSIMYVLHSFDKEREMLAFSLGVASLALFSNPSEMWALFMLIPIFYYDGRRGADNAALRTFFYLFYPAHIVLIGLVAYLLKI